MLEIMFIVKRMLVVQKIEREKKIKRDYLSLSARSLLEKVDERSNGFKWYNNVHYT